MSSQRCEEQSEWPSDEDAVSVVASMPSMQPPVVFGGGVHLLGRVTTCVCNGTELKAATVRQHEERRKS